VLSPAQSIDRLTTASGRDRRGSAGESAALHLIFEMSSAMATDVNNTGTVADVNAPVAADLIASARAAAPRKPFDQPRLETARLEASA
jgi:hypothetical protein